MRLNRLEQDIGQLDGKAAQCSSDVNTLMEARFQVPFAAACL